MDIDTQDELLVEYDDGDAPMREEEGDAEMLEGGAGTSLKISYLGVELMGSADDNDDTPMVEDEVIVITDEAIVEETEIDMQPADEDDVDTPMREDEPSTTTMAEPTISEEPATTTITETEPAWPPQPTDVPPVPSLLPSALSVPQETRHEEGKIHDGDIPQTTETASVVAQLADEPSGELTQKLGRGGDGKTPAGEDDATSQVVEPALSVRGSEFGTNVGPGTTAPPSAAPSIIDNTDQQQQRQEGGEMSKEQEANWPPAPTEVPAVPSMLPSALAVPEPVAGEGVARAEGEGRGSAVADDGSVVVGGEKPLEEGKSLQKGKELEESRDAVVPVIVGESTIDPDLVPIVLVINATQHRTLFSPLPEGIRYLVSDANGEEQDLTDSVGDPLLSGMAVDVFRAPLSEVFQGLRDALVERDSDFSVKRGKELVLDVPELELSVGEVSRHAAPTHSPKCVLILRRRTG